MQSYILISKSGIIYKYFIKNKNVFIIRFECNNVFLYSVFQNFKRFALNY